MRSRSEVVAGIGAAQDAGSVHQPDLSLTTVVPPKDIGVAVAIEIRRGLHMPCRPEVGADIGTAQGACSIHQPDRSLTIVVLQQDVGLAVAVEIPGALDVQSKV